MYDSTHKRSILERLKKMYPQGLTASQIPYSNANQYLGPLENEKLIKRYWERDGKRRFKVAIFNVDNDGISPKKVPAVIKSNII